MSIVTFSNGLKQKFDISADTPPATQAIEAANRLLNQSVPFAEAIAASAAISSGCRWAAVSRLTPNSSQVEILALYDNGKFVDCFSYDFNKTPCAEVLGQENFCFFRDVQRAFPDDPDLEVMGVSDYAGLSFGRQGEKIDGHLFVMHDTPLEKYLEVEDVLMSMVALIKLEWDAG